MTPRAFVRQNLTKLLSTPHRSNKFPRSGGPCQMVCRESYCSGCCRYGCRFDQPGEQNHGASSHGLLALSVQSGSSWLRNACRWGLLIFPYESAWMQEQPCTGIINTFGPLLVHFWSRLQALPLALLPILFTVGWVVLWVESFPRCRSKGMRPLFSVYSAGYWWCLQSASHGYVSALWIGPETASRAQIYPRYISALISSKLYMTDTAETTWRALQKNPAELYWYTEGSSRCVRDGSGQEVLFVHHTEAFLHEVTTLVNAQTRFGTIDCVYLKPGQGRIYFSRRKALKRRMASISTQDENEHDSHGISKKMLLWHVQIAKLFVTKMEPFWGEKYGAICDLG